MSIDDILDQFKDLNHVYNDCTKIDLLRNMLEMYAREIVFGSECETCNDNLISVQKEPKTGQWIYCYTNGFGRQILKCSKCGFKGDALGFNYCPNCGQPKMEEVKE